MRRAAAALCFVLLAAGCVTRSRYVRDTKTLVTNLNALGNAQNAINTAIIETFKRQQAHINQVDAKCDQLSATISNLTRSFDARVTAIERALILKPKFGQKPIKAAAKK